MKDLIGAMQEEKRYISDRMSGIDTSFLNRLSEYGYNDLNSYFADKRLYLFNEWKPEVFPIDVKNITVDLENAILNKKYGIYISQTDGLYAFHGSDLIDYNLCEKLNISVAELRHNGGTIIGGKNDLGIEIVAPADLSIESSFIMDNIHRIISQYVDGAIIDGNDILVNGEKVMGSMQRLVGNVFVWAAQISFEDHTEIISQICNKQSVKKPSFIDNSLLTRDKLESEVIKWLLKH